MVIVPERHEYVATGLCRLVDRGIPRLRSSVGSVVRGALGGAFDPDVLLVATAAARVAAAGVAAAAAVGATAGGFLRRHGGLRHRRTPFFRNSVTITDSPFPRTSNTTREHEGALGARQGVLRWRKRGAT